MDLTIRPGKLSGQITAIPSKSQAHRSLICAAFADRPTELICPETNLDIEATAQCLRELGADIRRTENGYHVMPISRLPESARLPCGESGSTLRFLLPLVGALGVKTVFVMEGRLPKRPLSPLWEEMERMGCRLNRIRENELQVDGKLQCGTYTIAGNVSSQFITGLLLALSLTQGRSMIEISGTLESKPYVDMTVQAMELFGRKPNGFLVHGGQRFRSPGLIRVEGDWSNSAFFLAAGALGNSIEVSGLSNHSAQGDRAVIDHLSALSSGRPIISARDIPDLIPVLSIVAAANYGAVFTDIQRLRLKESDRVASTIAMIENLGGKAEATESTLTVYGTGLTGGTVKAVNDHRIAMSAAIAATVCHRTVTIIGAECVKKSYPQFWDEYKRLGGQYEQHIR